MATVKQKPKGKSVAVTKRSVVAPPPLRVHDAPGEQTMHVEMMPILDVKAYGKNPRIIPQSAIDKTAKSIKEFGWRQPIVVDEAMTIIVGHTRQLAAASLGMTQVPVHVARGLTKAQVKAYRLADNRVGSESAWDKEILFEELGDLRLDNYDLALTGFDPYEYGLRGGVSSADEWQGMPEFEHADLSSYQMIKVHFKNAEDVAAFGKLIGQPVTPRTRSIWVPEAEIEHQTDKTYDA